MKRFMVISLLTIFGFNFCVEEKTEKPLAQQKTIQNPPMLTFSKDAFSKFFEETKTNEKNKQTNEERFEALMEKTFKSAIPIDHRPDTQSYIFYWNPEERTSVGFLNNVVNKHPIILSSKHRSQLTITFPKIEEYNETRYFLAQTLPSKQNFPPNGSIIINTKNTSITITKTQ